MKRNIELKHNHPLLECIDVCGATHTGRILFEGLNMALKKEKVALIGRNGVGKSTLIEILSGMQIPDRGQVRQNSSLHYVPQQINPPFNFQQSKNTLERKLETAKAKQSLELELLRARLMPLHELRDIQGLSQGELRKLLLLEAKLSGCDLLILDEPTQDLDEHGIAWLMNWLREWPGGLLLASHEIELLREFHYFFIVAETGCECFEGTFNAFTQRQEKEFREEQNRYVKNLNRLSAQEELIHRIARRRLRKKQFGRANEMGRATPKITLNQKRDYAQVKHGLMKKNREAKLNHLRQQTRLARRTLKVQLPGVVLTQASIKPRAPLITLTNVTVKINGRILFKNINLTQQGQRIAVVGPNGSGKTTLLHTLLDLRDPTQGHVSINKPLVGSILQGGSNWLIDESVLDYLMRMNSALNPEELGIIIRENKFPLALAERPLHSLSPGERVRAALICLLHQKPPIELLVLDEPTYSLDLLGLASLREFLKKWLGGLVIVSHSRLFLKEIGVDEYIELG